MILCRVKGNIVASMQFPCYDGKTILIVQPIDETGKDMDNEFLACDTTQAASGDVVLVEREGNTARELLGTKRDPFHSVIVGRVDKVSIEL